MDTRGSVRTPWQVIDLRSRPSSTQWRIDDVQAMAEIDAPRSGVTRILIGCVRTGADAS